MPISSIVKKIIKVLGEDILLLPRIETVEEGEKSYQWGEQVEVRGQVSQLTGYSESWERPGMLVEAEWLVTFEPEVEVHLGDLLKIDNVWGEVVEIVNRNTKGITDFKECLVRRRKA